jgi:diguanylate cyclase
MDDGTPDDQDALVAPGRELIAAAELAVAHLREQTGLGQWVLARAREEGLEVVHSPAGSRFTRGQRIPRSTALSARVVECCGPAPAPDQECEPSEDPSEARPACIGAPIRREDGFVFGTLFGYGPQAAGTDLEEHLPLVEVVADLLGRVWSAELRAHAAEARAVRAEAEASTDPVTAVSSRRSWDEVLEAQEVRSRRYGHSASIVLTDLDGLKRVNDELGHAAGDDLLRTAARAIASATRSGDIVARLGGDEFGILAVESDEDAAATLAARVRSALEEAGVEASVGFSTRGPSSTLRDAWERADKAMYASKRRRGRGGD